MLSNVLLDVGFGSIVRIVAHMVTAHYSSRHDERMLSMSASNERLSLIQKQAKEEHVVWTIVKAIVVLMNVGLHCYLLYYLIVLNPNEELTILVDKQGGFFSNLLFSSTSKEAVEISRGQLIYESKELVYIVFGFLFAGAGVGSKRS